VELMDGWEQVEGSSGERVREARATVRQLIGLQARDGVWPEREGVKSPWSTARTAPGGSQVEPSWKDALARLGRTYRWGREAMAAAYQSGEATAFGGWRMAVAYHGLQLRVLAELCPGQLEGRLDVIARLEELLGQDARLAHFAGGGWTSAVRTVQAPEANLIGLVDQRHQALRALARPLGRRLFAEPPGSFCRGLNACWLARRRGDEPWHPKRPRLRPRLRAA
jgi:hypothetical protein